MSSFEYSDSVIDSAVLHLSYDVSRQEAEQEAQYSSLVGSAVGGWLNAYMLLVSVPNILGSPGQS